MASARRSGVTASNVCGARGTLAIGVVADASSAGFLRSSRFLRAALRVVIHASFFVLVHPDDNRLTVIGDLTKVLVLGDFVV